MCEYKNVHGNYSTVLFEPLKHKFHTLVTFYRRIVDGQTRVGKLAGMCH